MSETPEEKAKKYPPRRFLKVDTPTKPPKIYRKKSSASFEDGEEPWRCRAKARRSSIDSGEKRRCRHRKEPGYEVCKTHGARGGTNIKHGRHSHRLGRFREMYDEAMSSEDILFDLRETLALLDVAVHRAAERVADQDTPQFRSRAKALFAQIQDGDPDAVHELGALLEEGGEEDDAFENLSKAAERMAVRQEKAWGIRLHAAQALNARDLLVVMTRIIDIITQEAPSKNAARIIERVDQEIVGGGEVASRLSGQS